MTLSRACPHCGSPARINPCWWSIKHPDYPPDGGDPPCFGDDYDENAARRDGRFVWRVLTVAVVCTAILLALIFWR